MATVVFPYTPVDGSALQPEQLARDIHSAVNAESLLGEMNGNIEAANLAPSFALNRQHLAPDEMDRVVGLGEGGLVTLHLDSRAFASASANPKYVTVAGLGLRWHQPWTATALISWDYFVSAWKMWTGLASAPAASASIVLQATLDGSVLQGTVTRLPVTAWSLNPTGTPYIEARESVNAQWRSFCHLTQTALTAGWHEVTYRIWIQDDSTADSIAWPSSVPGTGTDPVYHAARVTIGHRHPQVILVP